MDEQIKATYIDKIKKEVAREPSYMDNKRLQDISAALRKLYENKKETNTDTDVVANFADDISKLLLETVSGKVATAKESTHDITARAKRADADDANKYGEGMSWEEENLGRGGGGKRRKTKKRRAKKRRTKKRRTSTRRTRRR